MESIVLCATVRQETGKGPSRRFRQKGLIPAIFYGPKATPLLLAVNSLEFKKTIKGKGGENVIVNLSLEGKGEGGKKFAMIREMQTDPLTREIIHVDFYEIDLKEKVEVAVSIELVGKAEGVKLGGVLQQIERELEIRCMPLKIPDRIEVDVSNLGIGDSIHVRDVSVGEGIEVLSSGEKTIVTLLIPTEEAERPEEEKTEEETPSAKKE
ncbi:MAG: 50S ribosomal protein L25/general stress protein Ctc [Pseudomonadota bacterium]